MPRIFDVRVYDFVNIKVSTFMLYAMDQKCKNVFESLSWQKLFVIKTTQKVRTIEHGVCEKAIITPKM